MHNPFGDDQPLHRAIWQAHIHEDIEAFLAGDWSRVARDFQARGFCAWDAHFCADPTRWNLRYTRLRDYRDEWLRQSAETRERADAARVREALFAATRLARVELHNAHTAVAHKVFDGELPLANGECERLAWQSLFSLKRQHRRWRVTSFIGYLPLSWQ